MEENTEVSKMYTRGFNQGYMMARYRPELLKGMSIPENEPSDYTQGFSDGQGQWEKERMMGHIRDRRTRGPDQALDRD